MQLGGSAMGAPDASSSSPRKAVVKKRRKKRRIKQSRLGQLAGMTDEEKSIWLFKHCQVQQGLPVYRSISVALGSTCMCNVFVEAGKLVALPAATKCCKRHSAQLQVCVSQVSCLLLSVLWAYPLTTHVLACCCIQSLFICIQSLFSHVFTKSSSSCLQPGCEQH